MKKKLWCFILLTAILLSVPAMAVNTISMNFIENKSNQAFAGGEMIGPLQTDSANWNSSIDAANLAADTLTDLIDGTGAATTADVTWESKNVWYNGDGVGSDEAKLAVGYLDDGDDGPSFTVTEIPFTTYDVYVLFTSDNNGDYTHGVITVNGTDVLGGGEFPAHGRVLDGTGWVEANGIVHGNYVRVSSLSGDLTVSSVRTPASRAPLTGFVITEVPDVVHVLDQSPANGATRVGQDVQLDWDVRSATGTPSFDVYFSDDPNDVDPALDPNTPTVPLTTTTDTFYTPPAPLDPTTMYYWRIDVSDDVNTVPLMGDVLTFTTGGTVHGVYPADGATGVETLPTISWDGDAPGSMYIDEYAVYLGETLPGTPNATVAEPNRFWEVPAELAEGTTYQCKIVALHMGTPVSEVTTSFTTGELVGHWPFDTDFTDAAGSADGTPTEASARPFMPVIVTGTENAIVGGGAAQFSSTYSGAGDGDPAGGSVVIQTPAGLQVATSFTISFWEKSNSAFSSRYQLASGDGDAGYDHFFIWRYAEQNRYAASIGPLDVYELYTADIYPEDRWHFVVITYDMNTRQSTIYVNAEVADSYPVASFDGFSTEITVGNRKNMVRPFSGNIDDLKIYNMPLSANQVQQKFIDDLDGAPYNPSPASAATNVFWDTVLGWTFAETPDTVSLEIGQQSDMSDATTYPVAGVDSFDTLTEMGVHLTPSTEYFWRVTATYPGKTAVGTVWSFTVRDLLGDLSGNLMVNMEDFGAMAAQWQTDSFEIVPSGAEHPFVDQEAWNEVDPNLAEYDAYVAPGGAWGTSELTVNTMPTPTDTNDFVTPTQTLLWTATGDAGQQQLCGVVFPRGPINFNEFDRFGFWTYQTNCDGNFQFRPITVGGAQPITKTVWGMNANNDKWHNYEWEIGGNAPDIYKVDIWVGDNEFVIEYGNFYLVKDGVEVPLCFEENWFAEDMNNDCVVDMLDVEILAGDWLLDASN